MRSKILAAVAFAGLLMMAIPMTASANDRATCSHEPGWGYTHPNLYRSWWQDHCASYGYGYRPDYFVNGGGWWSNPPVYGPRYVAPRYVYNGRYSNDWYRNGRHFDANHNVAPAPHIAHQAEVHPYRR